MNVADRLGDLRIVHRLNHCPGISGSTQFITSMVNIVMYCCRDRRTYCQTPSLGDGEDGDLKLTVHKRTEKNLIFGTLIGHGLRLTPSHFESKLLVQSDKQRFAQTQDSVDTFVDLLEVGRVALVP
jgi:hypothetical protein